MYYSIVRFIVQCQWLQWNKNASVSIALLISVVMCCALQPQPAHAVLQTLANVARNPTDLPPQLHRKVPTTVHVNLVVEESIAEIAPGKPTLIWTYREESEPSPKVPGPMIRVMEGDTVEIKLSNATTSQFKHDIDFHASLGPGGGAQVTSVTPGQSKTLSFKALRAGAYIYHCAAGAPWEHVARGMYGLIMVEPRGGLPTADKEFYIGQSDWYLSDPQSDPATSATPYYDLDMDKALQEHPDLITFNGHTQALTSLYPANATQNDSVRFFFVNGGPNIGANWHIIGTIFSRIFPGDPKDFSRNEETVNVPPGSAEVFEMTTPVPGRFLMVDHALFRVLKGAQGYLDVCPKGAWPTNIFSPSVKLPFQCP